MNEDIRPIPGFYGYGVTPDGRVWSQKRGGWSVVAQSAVSHKPGAQGYLKVGISDGHKRRYPLVHTLVASVFLGPKPDGMQVNHKDGNTHNNSYVNLEYTSQEANIRHAFRHGLNVHKRGSEHPMAKLDEDQVRAIRADAAKGASIADLARSHHVTCRCISQVITRETWRHVA